MLQVAASRLCTRSAVRRVLVAPHQRGAFFHSSASVWGAASPIKKRPEYYLLKTTRKCPVCNKKFKERKAMLQHLFDPLGRHSFKDLPKELAVPLRVEATKRLGPKHF